MINHTTLLPVLAMCISTFTGCKVYYTTSEVNSNLKSTVEQVNYTLAQFNRQVTDMEKEYRTIPCEKKTDAMLSADKMIIDLDRDMQSLTQLQQSVNNDYTSFTQYTQGKSKIESGTEEWKKLKQTKTAMKTNVENLQNQGNRVLEEAQKFNTYVNANVIPSVQVCEVNSYSEQFEKAVSTLGNSLKIAQGDLSKYDSQIARIIAEFGATAASTCTQLTALTKQIHSDIKAMEPIHQNAQRILTDFKMKTKGMQRIYSCNENWHLVAETETAIRKQEQDFNSHRQSITTTSASIQQLVNSLQK